MNRADSIRQVEDSKDWDVVVIGGGASGLGVAMDAASRGYRTLLLEQYDFSKGTSSRSTKLVHGGVRYLAQGDISLVLEALRERGRLRENAPHLFENRRFIIPSYDWWSGPFYTLGLKVYDKMSGDFGLGPSEHISKEEVQRLIPNLQEEGLRGGVIYHDGQFDDSRLAVNLAQTISDVGGTVLNYAEVKSLLKNSDGVLSGVRFVDKETDKTYSVSCKIVVNATGVFADNILQMDDPLHQKMVVPSQGVHLVLDSTFLPGDYAIMIPKTTDGRVLFAVPWHEKVIIGTTDTVVEKVDIEPRALEKEIEFILETAGEYLERKPTRNDVLSVFAGLRPLVGETSGKKESVSTKEISRSHKINISPSGLITVIGGKWTTFRQMGEDVVNKIPLLMGMEEKVCNTCQLKIHGYAHDLDFDVHWHVYGSDLPDLRSLLNSNDDYSKRIHPKLPYTIGEIVWAVRNEMARTVEDFLARRTRALFLHAQVSIEMAPKVANIMANELGKNIDWIENQIQEYTQLALGYTISKL